MAVIEQPTETAPANPGWLANLGYFARRYPLGAVGAVIMTLFVLMAIFAPLITQFDPTATDPRASLLHPGPGHVFGADFMGRDMWSRIVYGARISLAVGAGSTGLGCLFGVTIGLTSGYFGGWYDLIVQRVMDMMQSLPLLVMALVMTAALGPSLSNTIIAISIPLMPSVARVIRSNTLMLREMPYVEAARAIGMGEMQIALRHVLPNTLAPLIVLATAQLGSTILVEAALSFLGLGVPEPHPSWGRMLSESAAEYVRTAPWLVIFPGLAISLAVFGTNLLGDALRDILDPAAARLMLQPQTAIQTDTLLSVEDLRTYFYLRGGILKAVDGVSFSLKSQETLAIVGESGCGKSMTALSLMRLIPDPPGKIVAGSVKLDGIDLLSLDETAMRRVRGKDISMIFQEPMTSLNPVMTVGAQIAETLLLHEDISRKEALHRAADILRLVRIPEAEQRLKEYPHQLSGGMRQRVMIAMALACNPKVLLADEPTTALDVTIQAQILDIILDLQKKLGTAVVLITHDLGVVAETAQRVIVMYAGKKVEEASVEELFAHPLHPYTHGLMASIPRLELMRGGAGETKKRLQEIKGIVPALTHLPPGCSFAPRCPFADDRCRKEAPAYEEKRPAHWAACWHSERLYGAGHA